MMRRLRLAFTRNDLLAVLGLVSVLAGIFLWFGLPPMLVVLGIVLIYTGAILPEKSTP